ncbi:uroporphyrinogen-III C-methyltransferase [Candidatus Laterigemmans baculatus]|uniref:uroporphyrinogen-III C-methyltransferase n=1 Tax=Candidatus Laterigemmans baculatus TaxID=2770505 RepID=UPI0013DA8EB1|nr:uroporphyrinogen-III C-methyltransferase [Candidatus Laterigemmans baculatus]
MPASSRPVSLPRGPSEHPRGIVYLVGAGPGDPGLLTLRGAEVLGQADVVLYDGLSNQALLRHAPGAEHICVGKHGQSRIWQQEEIIDEMLRHARSGRAVVRLKGGDPAVFARTAEEVAALRAAEIPLEIVPGITAALAAGSYAGIPVTHRGLASAVALVTGHEEPSKTESALDWEALARFPGTLVIYMGVTTAETWTSALLSAGKPPETPAAILRRCSLPDQQTIHCRLDEVASRLTPASRLRPPVIVIVGAVTELAATMSWFDSRPLFGTSVLVTRATDQAEELAAPLRRLGAEVLLQPAITIDPPEDWTAVDAAIERLGEFDCVAFSSCNGVAYFLQRIFALGKDVRALGSCTLAAVGTKTAEALARYHLRADYVPETFVAEGLAATLAKAVAGRSVLLPRASRGREALPENLRRAGAEVTEVVTYQHRDVLAADPVVHDAMAAGRIGWTTVTSSGIAESLVNMFGDALHQTRLVSISPLTSATLRRLGFAPAAEATEATLAGIIEALQTASSTP